MGFGANVSPMTPFVIMPASHSRFASLNMATLLKFEKYVILIFVVDFFGNFCPSLERVTLGLRDPVAYQVFSFVNIVHQERGRIFFVDADLCVK